MEMPWCRPRWGIIVYKLFVMFQILCKATKKQPGDPEYQWKIGDEKPYPDKPPYWLRATGNELQYIRDKFQNIPIKVGPNVNHCDWSGEMAKFIYDNL
jgi:hypothetical protein